MPVEAQAAPSPHPRRRGLKEEERLTTISGNDSTENARHDRLSITEDRTIILSGYAEAQDSVHLAKF